MSSRRIDQIDTQRVCEYASEDADFTWRLYEILEKQMKGSHVESLFRETEMPLVDVLAAMEQNGISLDTKLLATLSETMSEKIEELAFAVHEAAERLSEIQDRLKATLAAMDEKWEEWNKVRLRVHGRCFPGVIINMLGESFNVKEVISRAFFFLDREAKRISHAPM